MAANKYDALCRIILQNVGGKENIISVTHCITRLRFKLRDVSKANTEVLESTDGVIKIMNANGQYQVVVGNDVEDIYDAFLGVSHLSGGGAVDEEGNAIEGTSGGPANENIGARIIDLVSGILAPTLGVMAAAGIIKGLLSLCTFFGFMATTDGAYSIWYAVGDGLFYFLPILLGYTSAKKFKINEFIGMMIGVALVYPTMVNITGGEVLGSVFTGTPFEMGYYTTFFGIPVIMPASGYTSSVIPVILAVWVASKIDHFTRPRLHESFKTFLAPFIVLVITVPLTYLIIGPVATTITNALTVFFESIYNLPVVGGALAGLAVGALWQVLVIFGFHWAVVSLGIINIAALGYDFMIPLSFACSWAQTFVVLAIFVKTKDEKLKKIALPAFISGLFGVTEPCIYGVTLPKKRPFVVSCALSGLVSMVIGYLGVIKFSSGGLGLFALPMYIDPSGAQGIDNMIIIAVAALVASVLGFVIEFALYKEEPAKA